MDKSKPRPREAESMTGKRTEVTLTETDNGFQVDVKGKSLKEILSCCCLPVAAFKVRSSPDCDPPQDCCPPENKKP
jgi:hypothetical protein